MNRTDAQVKLPDYQYAEIFYFNTEYPMKERPQHYLYQDGIYAQSKVGQGMEVSSNFVDSVVQILSKGVDDLYTGLSKTFMPTIGLLLYDSLGIPIATISFCFDCEILRWWPQDLIQAKEVKKANIKKAVEQNNSLRELFSGKIPVFYRAEDYHNFTDTAFIFQHKEEMEISDSLVTSSYLIAENIYENDVRNWVLKSIDIYQDSVTKITHGGDVYHFKTLVTKDGETRFLFSDTHENSYLAEAVIRTSGISPFAHINIGMGYEQFKRVTGLTDLLNTYEKIIFVNKSGKSVIFKFKKGSLREISF